MADNRQAEKNDVLQVTQTAADRSQICTAKHRIRNGKIEQNKTTEKGLLVFNYYRHRDAICYL